MVMVMGDGYGGQGVGLKRQCGDCDGVGGEGFMWRWGWVTVVMVMG